MIFDLLAPMFVGGLFIMILSVAFAAFWELMAWLVSLLGGGGD